MITDLAPADGARFLRLKDVLAIVPVSKATLYRRIKDKQFPEPQKFGGCVMWPERSIAAWQAGVQN